jgi:hypothetical protein
MDWKWSNGEPYKKSKRPNKNDIIEDNKEYLQDENEMFSKEVEKSAYSTSLNHDENTWDILNQGFLKQSSKREILDNKIADRELVQQKGFNPFLNESNYVQDISNSDMYLKPMNTTLEREKNKINNE